jgi:hypothetical protein
MGKLQEGHPLRGVSKFVGSLQSLPCKGKRRRNYLALIGRLNDVRGHEPRAAASTPCPGLGILPLQDEYEIHFSLKNKAFLLQ